MNFNLTQEFLEEFSLAIKQREAALIRQVTDDMHFADIILVLDEFNSADSYYVMSLLDQQVRSDIIADLPPDVRSNFLKQYPTEEIAQIIDCTDSDDAADILSELPIKLREEVIAHVANSNDIIELLHYEEDCAGGLMAKELVKANIDWTVDECVEEIRRQAKEVEKVYSVYVVDSNNKLKGRVSLKLIALSNNETKIAEIYTSDVISVYSYQSAEEVANIMQKYDLDAIPVLNVTGNLLGRITIDDIVDLITEQAEHDIQTMAGISEDVEEDDSVWRISRARLPWLLIGMVGGMMGANFIGLFEEQLTLVPAMAFFIPLITATGGNVGIQSSTLVVQALADTNSLQERAVMRLLRSFLVALINGFVIAICVLVGNMLLTSNLTLSLVVAVALFAVVIIASIMGTITPLLLHRFNINPAVASGPFITTANDLIGLAVYFSVAKILFSVTP